MTELAALREVLDGARVDYEVFALRPDYRVFLLAVCSRPLGAPPRTRPRTGFVHDSRFHQILLDMNSITETSSTDHTAATEAPAPTAQPAPPALAKNGLGLAALIVGIVGLVLAFLPIIGGFGGFLAFVGLVLGIVALVLKGKRKGIALAGTIVSGVALIMSIVMGIAYAAAFVATVDESLSGNPTVISPAEEPATDEAPAGEPSSDEGTRANPLALGSTVSVEGGDGVDWEITPTSSNLNVTEQVKAANMFNADPQPGNQYASLAVDVHYVGPDSGRPFELTFTFVSAEGRAYDGSFVTMDWQLSDVSELYADGRATGNVIIEIPEADAAAGTWTVSYIFGDPIFFSAV